MAYNDLLIEKNGRAYLTRVNKIVACNSTVNAALIANKVNIAASEQETGFPFYCYGVLMQTTGLFRFYNKGTSGEPSGAEGDIYYNGDSHKIRRHNGTAWDSIATLSDIPTSFGWVDNAGDLQLDTGYPNLLLYPASGTWHGIYVDSYIAPITDVADDLGGASKRFHYGYIAHLVATDISVTSTSLVSNLNADKVDGFHIGAGYGTPTSHSPSTAVTWTWTPTTSNSVMPVGTAVYNGTISLIGCYLKSASSSSIVFVTWNESASTIDIGIKIMYAW